MIMSPHTSEPLTHNVRGNGVMGAFRDGIFTNVLNPKVALFFLALMPQFIAPDSSTKVAAFIALGLTFVTTGTIWCLILAIAAGRLRNFFVRHPRGWRAVSQAAGGLFHPAWAASRSDAAVTYGCDCESRSAAGSGLCRTAESA